MTRTLSRQLRAMFVLALAGACSRELGLPPAPGSPSLSGRVMVAEPGTGRRLPAEGVFVELLRSNLSTRTNADGRFTVGPLAEMSGTLSLRFDADGDGRFERQRLAELATLAAGRSGAVEAGELLLSENAFVRGRALLGDLGTPTGHPGIVVYVPGSPFSTVTSDNGLFTLRDLPDGIVEVAAFHAGYESSAISGIQLVPGQVLDLRELTLAKALAQVPVAVRGVVRRADSDDASGLVVTLVRPGVVVGDPSRIVASTTTGADGSYTIPNVPPGLYDLEVTGAGVGSALVPHVLVSERAQLPGVQVAAGQAASSGENPATDGGGPPANRPPVARATDLRAVAGDLVRLDASASSDPDDDPLLFSWVQLSGPTVLLDLNQSTIAARPVFQASPEGGVLTFTIRVTDPLGEFAEATCTIALNRRPIARTEPFVILPPGNAGALDGSASSDPDQSGPLTHLWEVLPPDGGGLPLVTLSSTSGAKPTFTAPATAGQFAKVRLTVSDGELTSDPVVVTIYATGGNFPPNAVAGVDADLDLGATIVLAPTGSSDPNGFNTISSYFWTFASTSPCGTLGGVNAYDGRTSNANGTATFTAPAGSCRATIRLRVTDNGGLSGTDELEVVVSDQRTPEILSHAPTVTSGVPAFGPVRITFVRDVDTESLKGALSVKAADGEEIDGTQSYDAPKHTLTYIPKLPFAAGAETRVRIAGVRSPSGRAMIGDEAFTFTAGVPTVQAPLQVTARTIGLVAGGHPDMIVTSYVPFGNSPQIDVRRTGATAWSTNQVTAMRSPTDAKRITVEEFGRFVGGRFYFARRDGDCSEPEGSRLLVVRVTPDLSTTTLQWSLFNWDNATNTYPGSKCASSRWQSFTVNGSQTFFLGVVEAVSSVAGGALDSLQVKAFQCTTCKDTVDNQVATRPLPAAWIETPALTPPRPLGSLRAVSLDATQAGPVAVWVQNDGAGPRLRGASYDITANAWTKLPGVAGDDLNAAGAADFPTVRQADNGDVWVAWVRTDANVQTLRVQRLRNGTWSELGGALNVGTLDADRFSMVELQGTMWISWAEPGGSTMRRGHVAWWDDRATTWVFPQGTAANGELPLGTGCSMGRPFLGLNADGTGVLAAYSEHCGTTGLAAIREIR